MYITKLENDLQNHGIKVNEEEGPKDKKPATKNRPCERPSLINPDHGFKMYEDLVVKMIMLKKTKRDLH